MSLGERLRYARTKTDQTQREVAKKAAPKDGYKRKKSLPHLDFQIAEALLKRVYIGRKPATSSGLFVKQDWSL